MSLYDELQDVASEILSDTDFKQVGISLIHVIPAAGPPDNPGTPTEQTIPLDAVARGISFKYVKDGFAVASDIEVTCAVVDGATPTLNDFIMIGTQRHKIIQDISPPAAGTQVVWKFIVRRGG